ncbi:hypothetical protein LWI29_038005 [Acer saccharum]|uniref:indole-3-glycerol-phosphate synthase n=1 Tax=Acer saccharum TaxID=4024 RepID=A0AA39SH17_ACESA|nr:hypothetical protein LWI29_038005 [Acer saccharum]
MDMTYERSSHGYERWELNQSILLNLSYGLGNVVWLSSFLMDMTYERSSHGYERWELNQSILLNLSYGLGNVVWLSSFLMDMTYERSSHGYERPTAPDSLHLEFLAGNSQNLFSVLAGNLILFSEADVTKETKDESATVSPANGDVETALKVKEWEVGMFHKEVAATQGIQIRRRPPTGPPQHYVAPFEFRIQSEGNTPCNILEEIVWHKDVEVAQLKERRPLFRLKNALDSAPPTKDFVGALRAAHQRTGLPSLIAEVKKASLSRGILREDFDPVHNEREMDRVLGIEGVELIGINNRNLETFEVDISNTKKLLEGERGQKIREKDIIVVGESGLFTPDDIAYVQEAGVKAVLVGESMVKQSDPGKGIAQRKQQCLYKPPYCKLFRLKMS